MPRLGNADIVTHLRTRIRATAGVRQGRPRSRVAGVVTTPPLVVAAWLVLAGGPLGAQDPSGLLVLSDDQLDTVTAAGVQQMTADAVAAANGFGGDARGSSRSNGGVHGRGGAATASGEAHGSSGATGISFATVSGRTAAGTFDFVDAAADGHADGSTPVAVNASAQLDRDVGGVRGSGTSEARGETGGSRSTTGLEHRGGGMTVRAAGRAESTATAHSSAVADSAGEIRSDGTTVRGSIRTGSSSASVSDGAVAVDATTHDATTGSRMSLSGTGSATAEDGATAAEITVRVRDHDRMRLGVITSRASGTGHGGHDATTATTGSSDGGRGLHLQMTRGVNTASLPTTSQATSTTTVVHIKPPSRP